MCLVPASCAFFLCILGRLLIAARGQTSSSKNLVNDISGARKLPEFASWNKNLINDVRHDSPELRLIRTSRSLYGCRCQLAHASLTSASVERA